MEDQAILAAPANATSIVNGAEIKKAQELDVIIDQSAVDSNDFLVAVISSTEKSAEKDKTNILISKTTSGNKIRFTADDLKKLKTGNALLEVSHQVQKRIEKDDKSLGGNIVSTYKSAPISIKIVE